LPRLQQDNLRSILERGFLNAIRTKISSHNTQLRKGNYILASLAYRLFGILMILKIPKQILIFLNRAKKFERNINFMDH